MAKRLGIMVVAIALVVLAGISTVAWSKLDQTRAELTSAKAEVSHFKQSLFWSNEDLKRARVEYVVSGMIDVFDGELTGAEEIEIIDLRDPPEFAKSIYEDPEGTHVKVVLSTGRTIWFTARHDGGRNWSSSSGIR